VEIAATDAAEIERLKAKSEALRAEGVALKEQLKALKAEAAERTAKKRADRWKGHCPDDAGHSAA